jgi:alanine dehydrogenase
MTLVIRDADVRMAVDLPGAVDAIVDAIREANAAGTPAHRVNLSFPAGWLRLMGGHLPVSDVLGFKAFHLTPNGEVRYLTTLYRFSTGEPLALVDANLLTVLRTSATAAAAARAYWNGEQIRVGVLGSGTFARSGLEALAAVCNVAEARVYSRKADRRQAFARDLRALDIPVEPVSHPSELAPRMDMLLCCTDTGGAIAATRETVDSVAYVSSVGSTLPTQRELDAPVIGDARVLVTDSPHAIEESGDLIAATEASLIDKTRVRPLPEFLASPNRSADGYTLYKSVGSVEQDLAIAAYALCRCNELGLGEHVTEIESPRHAQSDRPAVRPT